MFVYMGAFMLFAGMLIVKLTKNVVSGTRVPWVLTEESWRLLQYFTCRVLVAAGVAEMFMCAFLLRGSTASVFTLSLMVGAYLIVLAYGWTLRAARV